FQNQIEGEMGLTNGYLTFFGRSRIIPTQKGTLVSAMVSQSYARVIYSTDNGQTWHNSNINNSFSQGNEDAIVETVDGGKLILIARNSVNNARRFESTDGGITWVDKSNAGVPTVAVNFGLARLDDPGQPYHGRIIHCAATASNAGFTGRGRMVVSINPDVTGVDKNRWDSRLLFDFTAVYSDVFYIPEDKSIYLTCESWYLGRGPAVFTNAPIRYFKFSYRYWTTLPDKDGNPVPAPPKPDYTSSSGTVIGGDSNALDSTRWVQHTFPMENITALSGGASHTGTPPTALTLTNKSTGGVNYTYALVHEYTGAGYDPATLGAIFSLQWSAGVSAYGNAPFFPALVQNGTVYKRAGDHNTDHQSTGEFVEDIGNASQWEEINSNALSSTELSLAGVNPDFSASGAPITFGIMQWYGSTPNANGTNIIRWATFTN
ncbi:MAG TPA: sialidase family protein, partial [Verrucomicrobiae bacterium]|nr:sialidase family protein [Verrucomicrobiae bacterium]